MMSNQNKKSSAAPLAIIVIVLILAVGGFAWLYSTSKPDSVSTTNNPKVNSAKTPVVAAANAPAGAAIGINMLGQPTAIVTIEEFADFQCPSCASAHPVMKDVEAAYAGNKNVRFIFRHYPLPMHDKSYDAASAVEAAGMQGSTKFWAMMDQMFSNQQTWANSPNYRELWKEYAAKIGLDIDKWQTDAAGLAPKNRIDLDIERARGVGVSSTPSVYINNRLIPFADVNVPTMKQLIEAELQTVADKASTNVNASSVAK